MLAVNVPHGKSFVQAMVAAKVQDASESMPKSSLATSEECDLPHRTLFWDQSPLPTRCVDFRKGHHETSAACCARRMRLARLLKTSTLHVSDHYVLPLRSPSYTFHTQHMISNALSGRANDNGAKISLPSVYESNPHRGTKGKVSEVCGLKLDMQSLHSLLTRLSARIQRSSLQA